MAVVKWKSTKYKYSNRASILSTIGAYIVILGIILFIRGVIGKMPDFIFYGVVIFVGGIGIQLFSDKIGTKDTEKYLKEHAPESSFGPTNTTLNNNPSLGRVYCCYKCHTIYDGEYNKSVICKKCNSATAELPVTREIWDSLPDDSKEQLINRYM